MECVFPKGLSFQPTHYCNTHTYNFIRIGLFHNIYIKDYVQPVSEIIQSLNSLNQFILFSVYNCNNLKNQTACHLLLNLCIAKLATELQNVVSSNNEEKWNLCLYLNHLNPRIDFQLDTYYVSDHQESVITDNFHASDILKIVALIFEYDGRFVRMVPLDLADLFPCNNNNIRLGHSHISFGTNIIKRCKWTVSKLWKMAMQSENNYFYELYLLSEKSLLYPVSAKMSFDQKVARWMTRRFFLFNSHIGLYSLAYCI